VVGRVQSPAFPVINPLVRFEVSAIEFSRVNLRDKWNMMMRGGALSGLECHPIMAMHNIRLGIFRHFYRAFREFVDRVPKIIPVKRDVVVQAALVKPIS